jgi:hypothetical protein
MGLTLTLAVSACDSDASPSTKASACAVPTAAPSATVGPADRAPGGGGLQVVDHGYTEVGPTSASVSLGALVRNTSSQIAYRTRVTLRVTDAQGRPAIHPWSSAQLILAIPVIMPGQEVPVASSGGLRTDLDPFGGADKVASFEVVLGPTQWLPADHATWFPTFTTTYRRVERDKDDPESGRVWYSVTSTSCRPLVSRGAAAVFFNPAGAVVGGAFDPDNPSPYCGGDPYDGSLLTPPSIPTGIDEAKTRVAAYCDLAAQVRGEVKSPDAPYN